MRANYDKHLQNQSAPRIIDSGATHHIALDTQSLTTTQDYHGLEEVIMRNGNTIPSYHTGNVNFNKLNHHIKIQHVLCAPTITNSLISVTKFCKDSNLSMEFFPFSYLVKDLTMRELFSRRWSKNCLYEGPPGDIDGLAQCNVVVPYNHLHQQLGHLIVKF